MTEYIIGTSGWHYDHWKNIFYPDKMPKSKWLEHFSTRFRTVELNNSFYRVPTDKAIATWHDSTPVDFRFTVKVNRYFTHIKRLKDCDYEINNFISKFDLLKDKLGTFLYQLPPSLKRDDHLLSSFLSILPERNKHVVEFRHESWINDNVFDILRKHNAGLCVFDMPGLDCPLASTADFAYVRFHGNVTIYSSKYTKEQMSDWAFRIRNMGEKPKQVYIYFNNDTAGFAFYNAETILGFLCNED